MATTILNASNVHAVITTRWGGGAYRPISIENILSYTIETNLDEDADPFTLVIGDIPGDLDEIMARDNEVRIQIFGIGTEIHYLLTGLVDRAIRNVDGRIVLSGRDLSSIPTDTICPPVSYHKRRASEVIRERATMLKCAPRINLMPTNLLGKITTDGSETEWEFWYRFIRRAGQWLWFEPDGTLMSGKMNYEAAPSYFFGTPPDGADASNWIPVETGEFQSAKVGRIYKAVLYYHDGNGGKVLNWTDPKIIDWLRQPTKLFESKDIHKPVSAINFVKDELFESTVGAQEVKLTVPDPGLIIRQNRMAEVNVPELGLGGKWFVIGTRILADETGFMQEVRLREKGYAISKRVPPDPQVSSEPGVPVTTGLPKTLSPILTKHPEWSEFFVNAAKAWHGNHEFAYFLAVLLAICEQETNFQNERAFTAGSQDGFANAPGIHGIEWFDWEPGSPGPKNGIANENEWKLSFANQPGSIVPYTFAVGPMQLYDLGLKQAADDFVAPNAHNELRGGRWSPEANIWVAAKSLHDRAVNLNVDVADNEAIWPAVASYGGSTAYANAVRNRVIGDDGWYQKVKDAYAEAPSEGDVAVEAISGNAKQLAAGILEYMKYNPPRYRDDNGQQREQLEKIANGQLLDSPCPQLGGVPLDTKVLSVIALLLTEGYYVGTFALVEDHDCATDSGNQSRHSSGHAVDISSLGKKEVGWHSLGSDSSKTAKDLVMEVMNLLKGQKQGVLKPDQMICNGVGGVSDVQIQSLQLDNFAPRGGVWVDDHLNHIHVGY